MRGGESLLFSVLTDPMHASLVCTWLQQLVIYSALVGMGISYGGTCCGFYITVLLGGNKTWLSFL